MESVKVDFSLRGYVAAEKTNPDLQKERRGTSFNPLDLTHVLDNGAENTDRKQKIEHLALSDPVLVGGTDYYYLSRPERYGEGMRKYVHTVKKLKEYNLTDVMDVTIYRNVVHLQESSPVLMHDMAFTPMFKIQASDEQKEKWEKDIEEYRIIGNYAQTELAHGTFVRGLQTTATYHPETEEFVINTPNLTSIKWWVGSLGKTSNYALVMAKLISLGKDHGLHAFMVPIRNMNTHEPLPGITVGDIGPKFGFDDVDNGYLQLDNVRIPRENMLNAHAKIDADGTYTPPFNDKIMYTGMLGIRALLPLMSARLVAKGCIIAIRYSLIRRQSELQPGGEEPQVLDFQTQQAKIFPGLALSYSFWFAARMMQKMHAEGMEEIMQGDFSKLLEMHALSSLLKAYCTTRTLRYIEQCRMSCGGHGYSDASGMPRLYMTACAPATAEGEATVLLLQSARYLMKCFRHAAKKGTAMDTFSSYMTGNTSVNFTSITLPSLVDALAVRAFNVVRRAFNALEKQQKLAIDSKLAWNAASVFLEQAAVAHAEYVLVKGFYDYLEQLTCVSAVKSALIRMCSLLAAHLVSESAGDIVEVGGSSEKWMDDIRNYINTLYSEIRPDAIAYADGFDFPDFQLRSILGRYDGNVYENMYQWAKDSPLNQTEVHDSYKYLKELRQSKL